ncbi:hypothetical protein HanIR_Chr10g0463621 [Helianthus annuus]|nr:hypothetical protein HanIR_Chr10g0463621 [Helianthus annuus]
MFTDFVEFVWSLPNSPFELNAGGFVTWRFEGFAVFGDDARVCEEEGCGRMLRLRILESGDDCGRMFARKRIERRWRSWCFSGEVRWW